jgi:hypothetical protein
MTFARRVPSMRNPSEGYSEDFNTKRGGSRLKPYVP